MNVPADLKYTDHDEWLRVDGDTVTLGISDYAQSELGELVHAELPEVGESVEAGAAVCEVESVKAVAEVFSPVGGEIVAVNEALDGAEETINEDPYGEGWLVRIKAADTSPIEALMDSEAYKKKIDEG